MIQILVNYIRLAFLLESLSVVAYPLPIATFTHPFIALKDVGRSDIQFAVVGTFVHEGNNMSSYEIARNERLLFDKDIAVPVTHSGSKQLSSSCKGYPLVQRTLSRYKSLHGSMHVPLDFRVPKKSNEWPEESWGMNLGLAAKNIRNGLHYRSKRFELEALGFCFPPIVTKYDTAKIALLSYQRHYGDMLVPFKFMIPKKSDKWPEETWGINLGVMVSNIRSGGSHADKREELISLGFNFNSRIARYELVKLALLKYKDLYGSTRVPQSFVVPDISDIWPKGMWGMNLGSIVHSIRGGARYTEKKQELIDIGFDFDSQKAKYGYPLAKAALLQYKKNSEKGDMCVPYNFKIPEKSKSWPVEMWGMKLGRVVNNIKGGNYADQRDDLIRMGFSFDQFQSKYQIVKQSLLTYKELNGDLLVPRKFCVPEGNYQWPKSTWGVRLGTVVYNIRGGSSYTDQRDDLLSIGFCYDALQARYDILKKSLLVYKEIYGNMLVPKNFEIPQNADWPSHLWGLKLGIAVYNIRGKKGSYADKKEELLSIGFKYNIHKRFDYECVRIAVYKYRELYHGSIRIPAVYNIPENDPWYPEETWGMCLGSIVTRIRQGAKWPEKRYELLGDY